jgi:hypothetical protein
VTGGRPTGGASTGGVTTGGGGSGGANPNARRLLLRDEGLRTLNYVNLANASENWYVRVLGEEAYPGNQGRDLQLVGDGRVMVGTPNGYEEYLIADGTRVAQLTTFAGTISAHRLRNRNTMLVSLSSGTPTNILLQEINASGTVVRTITYANYAYVRLVREMSNGNFMVTSNTVVFEGRPDGTVVRTFSITGSDNPHAWKALRLPSGDTVVGTGYAAALRVFASDGSVVRSITGPASVTPSFYCDFQILPSGNYVVVNWQGHGTGMGNTGRQLLEYTPTGSLVWYWQQDANHFSSLQAVIVLDGLDTSKLHVEDTTGQLVPVG